MLPIIIGSMDSRWHESDAAQCKNELALRAYSSRLLGGDPTLVLHGGGNTSIKCSENDAAVLYVKGTGSDLAMVNERAFTPLRLDGVMQVLSRQNLDNADMMRALDACLARRPAPRPSIETLLHAALPFRCVEHTHADSALAAMNVERMEDIHAKVYGDRAPLVPYRHSGHALARACIDVFDANSTTNTIGLILAFHGVVAFGKDVRSSYEHMIELVTRAEHYLQSRGAWRASSPAATAGAVDAKVLQRLQAEVSTAAGLPLDLCVVSDTPCLAFAQRKDLPQISQQGPATPQHAVYTKRVPMIDGDIGAYVRRYRAYLDTHLGVRASARIDAAPRIVLDPAIGLIAFGKDAAAARIAADMFRHDIAVITQASAHGRYRSAPPGAIALAEFEYGGYAAQCDDADLPLPVQDNE